MSRPPIGEIMVELGLLQPAQVQDVLLLLRERERGRFGELAIELGFVDEGGLALSVAQQYGLPTMDEETVEHLGVPREVLELLPFDFMRDRLLVPTFHDELGSRLSLLIADPTDLPSQHLALDYARARDLRLFVSTRTAIGRLLDRLLPRPKFGDTPDVEVSGARFHQPLRTSRAVVFEPDPVRASVLRRLETLEGGDTEYVRDPDQVTALLEAGAAHAVIHRDSLGPVVAPYIGVWKRARPGLPVFSTPSLGPGAIPEISGAADANVLSLLERVVVDGLDEEAGATAVLVREILATLSMAPDRATTVRVAALFLARGDSEDALAGEPEALDLLDGLRHREAGAPPSADLGVEVLFSARHPDRMDGSHHPDVVGPLRRAERHQQLVSELEAGKTDVKGRLADLDLGQLLRLLAQRGASALVTLSGGAERGMVHVDHGEIVAARWGDRRGAGALKGLAQLHQASFELAAPQEAEPDPDLDDILSDL